ncbi:MAG TPA: hypothetical protein VF736_01205 [Pyrinomonadaceae bacterium]|jgi:hypothetical protein
MSELKGRLWAVLSERGREQAGLTYEEAAGLVARLRGERVTGLCIVTAEAASRVPEPRRVAPKPAAAGNTKPRRGRKKSAS